GSSASLLRLAKVVNLLTGWTTKKKTTIAMTINDTRVLIKSPYGKMWFLPIETLALENSPAPPEGKIGVIISLTKAWMTVLKAAPMTTPTAKSTTLPRRINFLNSLNITYI